MTYGKTYADKKAQSENVRVYDMDVIVEKNIFAQKHRAPSLSKGAKGKTAAQAKTRRKSFALESDKVKVVAAVSEKPKVRTIKAIKTTPFPTAVVFVSIICTVLFMFMMYTMAQINEFTQDISALQGKLSELANREKELLFDVELKNNLKVIEDMASNELGMIKSDKVQKQYLIINNEDKIEVIEPETTENGVLNTIMSAIGENFKQLLEYIN